ncbi:MAG: hypothetical protein Q7S88_03535, partial [Candidatus Daviesbacteria bacterium]|nr:hypothetical protein [Candidatus Daviesbacteria bacterium]
LLLTTYYLLLPTKVGAAPGDPCTTTLSCQTDSGTDGQKSCSGTRDSGEYCVSNLESCGVCQLVTGSTPATTPAPSFSPPNLTPSPQGREFRAINRMNDLLVPEEFKQKDEVSSTLIGGFIQSFRDQVGFLLSGVFVHKYQNQEIPPVADSSKTLRALTTSELVPTKQPQPPANIFSNPLQFVKDFVADTVGQKLTDNLAGDGGVYSAYIPEDDFWCDKSANEDQENIKGAEKCAEKLIFDDSLFGKPITGAEIISPTP